MDQLRELGKRDPQAALEYRKFIFSKDTYIDKGMALIIPDEEILNYPGSDKGPDPEDDPESYAKWFVTH